MRRIAANRCGYNGYTCTPLGKLQPIFAHTGMVWDGIPEHMAPTLEQLDNYKNIPAKIEGFLMTLPQIPDMSQVTLEVPELSCRVDFDPLSDAPGATKNDPGTVGGFLDNYNVYKNGGTYVSAEVEGATATAEYVLKDTLPEFEAPYILQPGLLEPMVDTSFDPVPIDQITAMEANNNGVLLSIGMLQNWRTIVDGRINDLYQKVRTTYGEYDAAGLIDMLNQKYKKSPCPNFKMTRTAGLNVIQDGSSNTPIYSISGGTVYVDGTPVEVEAYGGTNSAGVFVAYLTVTENPEGSEEAYTGTISVIRAPNNATPEELQVLPKIPANTDTTFNFQIGGVRLVPAPSNTESHGTKYQLYELVVDECLENIELSGGTGGGSTVTSEYDGPFKVVKGTTAGYVSLEPFDILGTSPQVYTGKIVNGDLPFNAPIGDVQITGATDATISVTKDIYAKIHLNTKQTEYVITVPQTRPENEQDIIYVRLARVTLGGIKYDKVVVTSSYARLQNTAIIGQTVTRPIDFVVDPQPALFNIPVGTAFPFYAVGNVYEVEGGTLTGWYGKPATSIAGSTVGATVIATQEKEIIQIQYGDIVLSGTTAAGDVYDGPFHVIPDGEDGFTFDCVEKDLQGNCVSIGEVILNGSTICNVEPKEIAIGENAKYVYAHVTAGTDGVVFDTNSSIAGTPPAYTVRLARLSGTTASQWHHGDIYVDGRWS